MFYIIKKNNWSVPNEKITIFTDDKRIYPEFFR